MERSHWKEKYNLERFSYYKYIMDMLYYYCFLLDTSTYLYFFTTLFPSLPLHHPLFDSWGFTLLLLTLQDILIFHVFLSFITFIFLSDTSIISYTRNIFMRLVSREFHSYFIFFLNVASTSCWRQERHNGEVVVNLQFINTLFSSSKEWKLSL